MSQSPGASVAPKASAESSGGDGEDDWWSAELSASLGDVLPADDPFYRKDFNLTEHINALFPSEQSLAKLDDTIAKVKGEITSLEREMGTLVVESAGAGTDGTEALAAARHAIQELFTRIREIKAKTDVSESQVAEMTRDIKQLDVAKRNLTASITTLTHLQMLLEWLSRLQGLVAQPHYAEMASILPSLLNVLHSLDKYMGVPQIADLASQVHTLRDSIRAQVAEDFKDSLTGARGLAGMSNVVEICRVVSEVDGGELKKELALWYAETQLAEYRLLFDDSQDEAWLDKVETRYAWFRRKLVDFEEKSAHLFPADWEMGRRLTREFCDATRTMLDSVASRRAGELDVKLLLHAIKQTRNFESLLCKRFPVKEGAANEFAGRMSKVFEGRLGVYVAAQEANLQQLLDASAKRIAEGGPAYEVAAVAQPLPSSGDLFLFFKRTILQVSEIATDPPALLRQIIPVFKRALKDYAHRCLSGALPKIGVAAATLGTTSGLIQSLLREGDVSRLSPSETFRVACILVTAEFCSETTGQLSAKLAERLGGEEAGHAGELGAEQEAFHSVTTAALTILVQDLEGACEAALATIPKMSWAQMEGVGDESPYVSSIKTHLLKTLPPMRDHLSNARRYFLNLCAKFSQSLVSKFAGAVMRLKCLSAEAASQLLLDTTSLRTFLVGLPTLDSVAAAKPPSVYVRPLEKAFAKLTNQLKMVTTLEEGGGPEAVVTQYLKLVPDSSAVEFQRVLELRGTRRADQAAYLDLYRARTGHSATHHHHPTGVTGSGVADVTPSLNAIAGPLLQLAGDSADSRIRKLEKLVKAIPR